MFSRIAALTGALLIASGSVFATGAEASTRKCELTAHEEGEIRMTPDGQWLVSEGAKPAVLGYNVVGSGTFRIKSTDSKVHRNGSRQNQIAKQFFQNTELQLSYDGGSYQQVWQNRQPVRFSNQRGEIISGNGRMNVHVKTNGHRNQNGVIKEGSYVVKSTIVCIVSNY